MALPPLYVQPDALGELAFQLRRIGQPSGKVKAVEIYDEQSDWDGGLCENVKDTQKDNKNSVKDVVEVNDDIKWAISQIKPIVDELKKIVVEEDEDEDEDGAE